MAASLRELRKRHGELLTLNRGEIFVSGPTKTTGTLAGYRFQGMGTDAYQALPANGRRIADLIVKGGTVVIPGLPPYRADLLINFGKPLLEEEGTIDEIGDLAEVEARDTILVDGLFIHPRDRALERGEAGVQIAVGAPAYFSVSRGADGRDPLWTFRGGPPDEVRRRR